MQISMRGMKFTVTNFFRLPVYFLFMNFFLMPIGKKRSLSLNLSMYRLFLYIN
ncbi:hypothetical protein NEOC95_002253 [Neochlamydia sp. AcF95]|nr:hypothetical protein [Neochlamydia sp. AcF95]